MKSPKFPATNWTLIFELNEGDSEKLSQAQEKFYLDYNPPLKNFAHQWIRQRGWDNGDAEDLIQKFFLNLLTKNKTASVNRSKGKLRTFLTISLKNFLANELRRERRQKRGGDLTFVPLENQSVIGEVMASPEESFDQQWAWRIMELALTDLREYYESRDRLELFESLQPQISERGTKEAYQKLADELDLTPEKVTNEVFQMRKRYRKMIRERLAKTLLDSEDIEDEFRYLKSLISKG